MSGFLDIDRQNALEERGIAAHLQELERQEIKTTVSQSRSGQFVNHVVGDPYAGLAKGPRDKP